MPRLAAEVVPRQTALAAAPPAAPPPTLDTARRMDFGGGDISADLVGSLPTHEAAMPRHAKRRKTGKTAPETPPGNERGTSSASAVVPEPLCCVCSRSGALDKQWRGEGLHRKCWNGYRAYARCLKSKKDRDAEQQMFHTARGKWQEQVLKMVVFDGGPRSAAARLEVAAEAGRSDYEETLCIHDTVLLPKRRYKCYMKNWEGWESDEASEAFEQALEEQSSEELDDKGMPRVRVRDNEVVRVVRRPRKPTGGRDGLSPIPFGSGMSVAGLDDLSPATTPRRGSAPSEAGSAAGRAANPAVAQRSLTAETLREHEDSGDAKAVAAPAEKKVRPVDLLRMAKQMKGEIDGTVFAAKMKSSVSGRLRAAIPKLSDADKARLDGNPEEMLSELDKVVKAMEDLRDVSTSTSKDLPEKKARFAEPSKDLKAKSVAAEVGR